MGAGVGGGLGLKVGADVGSGVSTWLICTVATSLTSVASPCDIKSPSTVTGRARTNASDVSSPASGACAVNRITRGASPGHWGSEMVSSNVPSIAGSVTIKSPQQVLPPPIVKMV